MKREYEVVYEPVEDGWVMATVPELPGAVTQGCELNEAREMIKEALQLLLDSYRSNARSVTSPNPVGESVTVDVSTS